MGSPVNWKFVFFSLFNLKRKMINVKKLVWQMHAKKTNKKCSGERIYTIQFIFLEMKSLVKHFFTGFCVTPLTLGGGM